MYKLVLDKPGERPVTVYLSRDQAFDLARTRILKPGMVTIFNDKDLEVYRHAQPFTREHSRLRVGAV